MTENHPKLRPLNVQWVDWEGRAMVSLQDPLRLGGSGILVPEVMAQLLALSDGTRNLEELRQGFSLRTGVDLSPSQVESLVQSLKAATEPKTKSQGAEKKKPERPIWLKEIEDNLVEALNTQVSVRYGRKRSKITIECTGREEFERVYNMLKAVGQVEEM